MSTPINHIRRGKTMNRSVRMSVDAWDKLKERAEKEGVPVNYVMEVFGTAYANGQLDLPTIKAKFD